jgi:hypothetical protein
MNIDGAEMKTKSNMLTLMIKFMCIVAFLTCAVVHVEAQKLGKKYGTYLGGDDFEWSTDNLEYVKIARLNRFNNTLKVVVGRTKSTTGIATANAVDSISDGSQRGFVVAFDGNENLLWGTYLPFIPEDVATYEGRCVVVGTTSTKDTLKDARAWLRQPIGRTRGWIQEYEIYSGKLRWESYIDPVFLRSTTYMQDSDTAEWSTCTAIEIDTNLVPIVGGAFQIDSTTRGVYVDCLGSYFYNDSWRYSPGPLLLTMGTAVISAVSIGNSLVAACGSTSTSFYAGIDKRGQRYDIPLKHQRNCNASLQGNTRDGFLLTTWASPAYQFGDRIIDSVSWLTYYGGYGDDRIRSVHVGGTVAIGGVTNSTTNIATPTSHQQQLLGPSGGFVALFDEVGKRLWGTYVGGVDYTDVSSVEVQRSSWDAPSYVLAAGTTASMDNISTSVSDRYRGGSTDGFVAQFDSLGKVTESYYIGGEGADTITSATGYIVSGVTTSKSGIATAGAHRESLNGAPEDAFMMIMGGCNETPLPSDWYFKINGEQLDSNQWQGTVCVGDSIVVEFGLAPGFIVELTSWSDLAFRTYPRRVVIKPKSRGEKRAHIDFVDTTLNGCRVGYLLDITVKRVPSVSLVQQGDTLIVLGSDSSFVYQWSRNGAVVQGANGERYTAGMPGSYFCRVCNGECCVDLGPIYVNPTGVKDLESCLLIQYLRAQVTYVGDLRFVEADYQNASGSTATSLVGRVTPLQSDNQYVDFSVIESGWHHLRLVCSDHVVEVMVLK